MVTTNPSSRRPISELALDDIVADVSTPHGSLPHGSPQRADVSTPRESLQRDRDPFGPVTQFDAPASDDAAVRSGVTGPSAHAELPSWPHATTEPGIESPFGAPGPLADPDHDAMLSTTVSEREEWSFGSRALLVVTVAAVLAGIAWIVSQGP